MDVEVYDKNGATETIVCCETEFNRKQRTVSKGCNSKPFSRQPFCRHWRVNTGVTNDISFALWFTGMPVTHQVKGINPFDELHLDLHHYDILKGSLSHWRYWFVNILIHLVPYYRSCTLAVISLISASKARLCNSVWPVIEGKAPEWLIIKSCAFPAMMKLKRLLWSF